MIVHTSVTEQIIRYMEEKIESEAWTVGEKIPSENQLTKELGVSRASVRDAIKYFTGRGVMETYHGKGTFLLSKGVTDTGNVENMITAEDCDNVRDVLVFRKALESEACAEACGKMDKETLELLHYLLNEMIASADDKQRYLKADWEFHRVIAYASGNQLFTKSLYRVLDESERHIERMYDLFGVKNGLFHHRKILEALESGKRKEAYNAMWNHMQGSLDQLKEKKRI